jgi:hypothetical protein
MYLILLFLLLAITTIIYIKSNHKPSLKSNVWFILFSTVLSLVIGFTKGTIELGPVDFPWWTISIFIAPPFYSFLLLGYFLYKSKQGKDDSETNST